MKQFIRSTVSAFLITALFISSFLISSQQAKAAAAGLGVTQITAVQTFATADNTFENGWKWVFDVTVPDAEPVLKMKFADWVKGSDIIPAAGNIRISSDQSSNATGTSPITIAAANTYSSEMDLVTGADLDALKPGRQIQITVEARIPTGSAGGSYSTSYGLNSAADTSAPVITLNGATTQTIEVGSSYTEAGATAHDNIDGDLTPTGTGTVNPAVVGVYTVTYNVSDSAGNAATPAVRTVHVVDTVAPVIIAPADVSAEATGHTTGVVLGAPTISDAGDPTPHVANNAPSAFPLGTTVVVWTATDTSGNSATTSQNVTITDTTKPIITVTGDNPAEVPVFGTYSDAGATVTDNYDAGLVVTTTGTVDTSHVGEYTLHYNVTDSNGNAAVEATRAVLVGVRPLTITADAKTKVYGEDDPTLTYAITSGALNDGDTITGELSRVSGEHVGTYAISQGTVTAGSNYSIHFVPANLTITASSSEVSINDSTVTYDGNSHGVAVATNPSGLSTSVTYNGSTVLPTDAGSYNVVATVTDPDFTGSGHATLTIEKAAATVSAAAANKIYDTTTNAVATLSVTGAVNGDTLTANGTAHFSDKNVGNNKTVTVTGITLSGTQAANYSFNTTATTQANITPADISVSSTGHNKVYDGTTAANVTLATTALTGDTVTASGDATFADKNIGTGKTITVANITLGGADALNYSLTNTTATTAADITVKSLSVAGLTANNKVYDGNTHATLSGTAALNGKVTGDDLALSGSPIATFSDKNAADGKTVTVTGFSLTGTDAGNYTLSQPSYTANITPKPLMGTVTAYNKEYDGTTAARILGRGLGGPIMGDDVVYNDVGGVFADKNVGNGKLVTVTGLFLSGADAHNYTVNSTASTTANITARAITVTAAVNTKAYDGNTAAAAIPTVTTGTIATGDVAAFTETYDNAEVGTGKTLTPAGSVTDGNSGNNYTVTLVSSANGVINKANQTIAFPTIPLGPVHGNSILASATSDSHLAVTFSGNVPGVCSVESDGTIHLIGFGQCVVVAHQAGDTHYNAAPDVIQNFTVDFTVLDAGTPAIANFSIE